jgi:hypothetical protein
VSARAGFTADNAEWQAGDAAAKYLNRALRTIAERFGLEKSLERDPAGFAKQFEGLLPALVETQSREYLAWVLHARLGEIAEPLASASHELSVFFTRYYDEQARRAQFPGDGASLSRQEGDDGR